MTPTRAVETVVLAPCLPMQYNLFGPEAYPCLAPFNLELLIHISKAYVDLLQTLIVSGDGWQEQGDVITLTAMPLLLEDQIHRCRTEGLRQT